MESHLGRRGGGDAYQWRRFYVSSTPGTHSFLSFHHPFNHEGLPPKCHLLASERRLSSHFRQPQEEDDTAVLPGEGTGRREITPF